MYEAEEVGREKKKRDRIQMWRENRNRNKMRGERVSENIETEGNEVWHR